MPLICSRQQGICHKPFTTRVLIKKQEQKMSSTETLRTFSVKDSTTSRQSRCIEGTTFPNSTMKQILKLERKDIATTNNAAKKTNMCIPKPTTSNAVTNKVHTSEATNTGTTTLRNQEDVGRNVPKKHEMKNDSIKNKEKEVIDKNSIISGCPKLQELKELHTQLRKTVYKPPPPAFEPRRPTIEAIKAAIEKAKQMSNQKNIGTDDDILLLRETTNDASTSTKKTKKKYSKKFDEKLHSTSVKPADKKSVKAKRSKKKTPNIANVSKKE